MIKNIIDSKIIPVAVLNDIDSAHKITEKLLESGLSVLEITLRTEKAVEIIYRLKKSFGTDINVGAGTVINENLAKMACEANADFLVSPGLNAKTIQFAKTSNKLIIPGVSTCTEIENGLDLGIEYFKFFPAEVCGGAKFLKAIENVYQSAKFMPTGGLNFSNFFEYLNLKNVYAVGCSSIIDSALIEKLDYNSIVKNVRMYQNKLSEKIH